MLRLIGGLEGLLASTISAFALFWLGLAAGIWLVGYAPVHWPNYHARLWLVHFTVGLPKPVGDGAALAALQAQEAAIGKRSVIVQTRYVHVGQAVGAQLAQSQAKAARVNRGLHTYINQVLTDSRQSGFSLTVGVVRVFNAAAAGSELSTVADPAGRADDAPSGISAADAASVFADDGKACLDWRDREAAWRAWWAGVSAANNLPQP